MPRLKVISNHGAGYNQIDYHYAVSKGKPINVLRFSDSEGIWVTNTPGVVGPATADVAMMHLVRVGS